MTYGGSREGLGGATDPLGTCELKYDEAYRFAMQGMRIAAIKGIEVAVFVGRTGGRHNLYVLERPALDTQVHPDEPVRYFVTEFSYDIGGLRVADPAEPPTYMLRDFAVLSDNSVLEVLDIPAEGRVEIQDDGTFDFNYLDMRQVASALAEGELLGEVLGPEDTTALLSKLARAVPADL